ncbi:hypothetical protein A6M21_15755 [Desulfotomaculum copahuensis]|uniref:Uncharacterized protein n=1 Tax=Desulfotomaculum copahuensis TaxID=1838280 RepID=A0A1B7LAZ1_9FIRM|nr:hypothetical protein A6M21_15755 [Desulfotomaculum copahuensis]
MKVVGVSKIFALHVIILVILVANLVVVHQNNIPIYVKELLMGILRLQKTTMIIAVLGRLTLN